MNPADIPQKALTDLVEIVRDIAGVEPKGKWEQLAALGWESPGAERRRLEIVSADIERVRNAVLDDRFRMALDHDTDQIAAALQAVQESIQQHVDSLPHPKERRALPVAAHGLLHLYHVFDCPGPKLWNDSDAVRQLHRVCTKAGLGLSVERVRGALSEAWKRWKGSSLPPELWDFERRWPVGCVDPK